MAARWSLAFAAAVLLTLGAGAFVRARGRRRRGSRARRLAGLGVVAGTLIALPFAPDLPDAVVAVALVALGLAVYGVADDEWELPAWLRLGAMAGAGVALVALGVGAEPTGTGGSDAVLTVLWVVALGTAVRYLDGSDGVAAGVVGASAAGVFALAAFGNQDALATVALGLTGACAGFLVYNQRPASLFLRDPGALFLGGALAALTVDVRPAISTPESLLVPLLLAAVPLLELGVVVAGRLARGAPLAEPARDHLVNRLARRGVSRDLAWIVLALVQLGLSAVAVFTGRGVLDPAWGLALGLAGVGGLAVAAVGAPVRRPDEGTADRRRHRRRQLAALGFVALVGLVTVPAVLAAAQARRLMDDGRALVEEALAAARAGEAEDAEAKFADAADVFARAHERLDSPVAAPGLVVPVVGSNLRAARELADSGADLALAGERLAASVDPEALEVVDGTIPLAEVERITPDLARGAQLLTETLDRIDRLDERLLVGPVADATRKIETELRDAEREAAHTVAAARLAPAILGGDGPRRYFLAVQNSAEQRATGGFIGNWGVLVAEDGNVRLEQFERVAVLNEGGDANARTLATSEEFLRRYERFGPTRTWQNVNMSPDFPTVGQVIADLYPQSGGSPVDGVLAVDPEGLAALLELTGPVTVAGWPEPLTADNVVDVTLRDAYARFADAPEREELLGDVAEEVVDTATEGNLGRPAEIARVLGRAAHEGHLVLAFTRPEEQALAEELEVAGDVAPLRSDSLLVTTQNAAGNKLDYYLERRVRYAIRLVPFDGAHRAGVSGQVEVELANTAPSGGLPRVVSGPHDERFVAGENRTFLSLYTPAGFDNVSLDGQDIGLEAGTELGRNVFSSFVSVFAGTTRTLAVDLTGTVELTRGGWYMLDLPRQPSLHPDVVSVSIRVPEGWRIADADGLDVEGRRAVARLRLTEPTRLRVRLERTGENLWERLHQGK